MNRRWNIYHFYPCQKQPCNTEPVVINLEYNFNKKSRQNILIKKTDSMKVILSRLTLAYHISLSFYNMCNVKSVSICTSWWHHHLSHTRANKRGKDKEKTKLWQNLKSKPVNKKIHDLRRRLRHSVLCDDDVSHLCDHT